jgi:hypothetical protein
VISRWFFADAANLLGRPKQCGWYSEYLAFAEQNFLPKEDLLHV